VFNNRRQKLFCRFFSGNILAPVVSSVAARPKGAASQRMPASRVFNYAVLRLPYDLDITTNDTSTPTSASTSPTPLGTITRARAHRLTHQVSLVLSSGASYLDNGDTCTLVLLRNNGLDQKGRGIAQAGFRLRTDTTCDGRHDFFRTAFWALSTSWKAYQIYFPTDPESPPYLFGVNRNRRLQSPFQPMVLRPPILAQ
jgi:hypothetical protein